MIFENRPKIITSLDLSEKSVKMIQFEEVAGKLTLIDYAIKKIPPPALNQEKEIRGTIAQTIKDMLAEKNIKGEKVYTTLSGSGVSTRRLTIPKMPPNELKEAIKWEAKNVIPFSLDTIVLDFHILGKVVERGIEKFDIMIVAVQKELLNRHTSIIQKAGLELAGVSAYPFSLWHLLKKNIPKKEGEVIALIDIGAEATSINLFKGGILQFTREITLAGESITQAMTGMLISDRWQLSLTVEQAEETKRKYGIPSEESTEETEEGIPLTQILEIFRPTLRRFLSEIIRSFDYYKEQFREYKIDQVFLTGGGSLLKNIENYLSNNLGTPVEKLAPLKNIAFNSSTINIQQSKENAPLLSMALGSAIGRSSEINFLSPKKKGFEKRKFVLPTLQIKWLPKWASSPLALVPVGGLLILAMLVLPYIYLNYQLQSLRQELRGKSSILSDLKALRQRRLLLETLEKQQTQTKNILATITRLLPNQVTITTLSYSNKSKKMDITGESPNTQLVGKFLNDLDASPYFSRGVLYEVQKTKAKIRPMNFKMSFYVN